jgi:hypothetical protein
VREVVHGREVAARKTTDEVSYIIIIFESSGIIRRDYVISREEFVAQGVLNNILDSGPSRA